MIIFWIIVCLVLCFGFVVLVGAPYVPTLKEQQHDALDLLDLKKGQTLLELGSGDGRMLRAAAQRGIHAVGYELNPFLVIVSYIVCFKYRHQISIRWGNFWQKEWPITDGIYVFLLQKFMANLDTKITQQYAGKKVKVVSYAFEIPGKNPNKRKGALALYQYGPK
ncbi:MAG: hypothetical protein U0491_02020 [Candidatus Saccharimonadales bacterium]